MKVGKKRMNPKNKKIVFSGGAIGATIIFVTLLAIYKIGDGWLGFWGGVIGSAIGVIGAFLVLKEQLDEEREQNRKQQIDNTFFNLLEMHVNLKERIKNERLFNKYYEALQRRTMSKVKELGTKKIINDSDVSKNLELLFLSYIDDIETRLKNKNIDVSEIPENNEHKLGYLVNQLSEEFPRIDIKVLPFYYISSKLMEPAKKILPLIDRIKVSKRYYNKSLMKDLLEIYADAESLKIGEEAREALKDLTTDIAKYEKATDYSLVEEKHDKDLVVTKVSNRYYHKLGSYFRLTHRIIKYLNDNVEDPQEKNNYIGFLRATVDETEMLVIFYNAYYTKRGEGLGKQLSKTTFFGKPGELGENQGFIQHFNREKLLWPEDDLIRMGQNKIK